MEAFKIRGEYLTKIIRDVWIIGEITAAIDIAMDGVGVSFEEALMICTGQKKLVGMNDLVLEDDNIEQMHGMKLQNKNADMLGGDTPINFNL